VLAVSGVLAAAASLDGRVYRRLDLLELRRGEGLEAGMSNSQDLPSADPGASLDGIAGPRRRRLALRLRVREDRARPQGICDVGEADAARRLGS
jgi:hypothetical protein